ncbi:MAG: phosphatidylserine decarboxylase [Oscillospiraceae bacterium]|nr:phosphatidylserine decarboxylase [Oscillospiraceae bacterium]
MKHRVRATVRQTKKTENNPFLRVFYGTRGGRVALKVMVNPVTSDLLGRALSTRASARMIPRFVRRTGIDPGRYEKRPYRSYNDFFTRKLADAPAFSADPRDFCSPCDAALTAMEIHADSVFAIKGTDYSVADLLCSRKLADTFEGGLCLIFRLAPENYHRYHWFDGGHILRTRTVRGSLHTVRPIAFEHFDVFKHNCREYAVVETDNFGVAVQIEVGAMFVGRIVNHRGVSRFERGEEKGYFEFGGSTVVVLLRPGCCELDGALLEAGRAGREVPVAVGQVLGRAPEQERRQPDREAKGASE